MPYKKDGSNGSKTMPPGGTHSPMGKLQTEKNTDASAFVKRDRMLGIEVPSTAKSVSSTKRM